MRARYAALNIPAELLTYIEDMPARLGDAHLVIARAGASTIAELTAAGRPAILVPLPIATDDHQTVNAREMAKAGGARMIVADRLHARRRSPRRSRRSPATRRRWPMPPAARCRSGGRTRRATSPTWSSGSPTALSPVEVGPAAAPSRAASFAVGAPGMKAMGTEIGTIHFVGIGGIGMSGIAEVMHHLGYQVQGSDQTEGYAVEGLRKAGIPVAIGQAADNLGDAARRRLLDRHLARQSRGRGRDREAPAAASAAPKCSPS